MDESSGVDLRDGDEDQDDRDDERENHHRGDHLQLLVVNDLLADLIDEPTERLAIRKGYPVGVSDAREIRPLTAVSGHGETYSLAHDRPITVFPAGRYSQPTQPS